MAPRIRQGTLLRAGCLAAALVLATAPAYAAPTWTTVASPNRGTVAM